ncbi:MAG: D-allose-binding periplasmic protein precursor [Planctomycetes bacterium ADurb.Bin126]|nr:MAG: D-allose-binding periplasmic protein precursor [Planctomycetes bacterium ADurb.Bin126]HOD84702.1 sugar ABC transporter substrate-binding protein [Phycisphaerae bacterium]HQL73356.1 sugar ABC transporter substrate-binding protein [Phycisphaerae bacterium]
MAKSILRCAAAVLAAMLVAAGCSGNKDQAAQGKGKPRIALVMKSLANEFFKTMEDGARAHQQAHADQYELIAQGIKNEEDVQKQIDIVDQMISQGVNAIVIAPANSKALVPVCKRAIDRGIKVVNIDNKFDDAVLADQKAAIPFVGPDNRAGARKAGQVLAGKLQAGDEVAIIAGIPDAFNGVQRQAGFEDAAKAANLKVVAVQSAYWEMNKANDVAAALLNEHPNLKGLLCANDSMALGAASAIQAAGKKDRVLLVGFDNIQAARNLLKEGRLLATVDQHGDQIAVNGIKYAMDLLKGAQAGGNQETPTDLITQADVK